MSRDLELSAQWNAIVSAGPCGPLCDANLDVSPAIGLLSFGDHVRALHDVVVDFLHRVVVYRRDGAVRAWRSWMLEDDRVRPYRWLSPDLVAPAPLLSCDPGLTVDGSGVLSDPGRIDEQFRSAWLPFFCRSGRSVVDPLVFDREFGGWFPHLGEFDFPPLLGSDLYQVVQRKRASAGGLDGWGWRELKAFPEAWFDWLAVILSKVELDGVWLDGLLDAYVTMIPKSDGDSTPLGQRPLCVLPVVYRIWASVRLGHLESWVRSWLPLSVFSVGNGRGSVDAWYSTALDFEEVFTGLSQSHVHVFVADVVKSFDTVDRGILDFVLGKLGLPIWFRRVYFSYHANVRLRFKLSCGLGSPWVRDGGIPQGCPLSMVFIVALYLPWCRALESVPGVRPQLYADNLKCVSGSPAALLSAARLTNLFISLVGQRAAPKKCVFLSTDVDVRKDMKGWVVTDAGDKWSVRLDVRDLGGHLDSTFRARAVTLNSRMSAVLPRVRAVAVLPLDFVGKLRVLRTMHLPGALHGAEASLVSVSGLRRLRTAFCQASLSGGFHLANPGAVLSLLDGPVGSDPGFHVVWCRFRMLRRYMAYHPSVHELARVYSLLRAVSGGALGHGPVHLLVSSALSVGFSWDPDRCVWIRPDLPILCQISSPFQFFRDAIWGAWRTKVSGDLSSRAGFRGGRYLDFRGSLKLLSSPHLRGGDKGLLRGILSGGVWNGFLLGFVKGEIVPCRFCGGPDGDGHLFWDCPYPPFVHIRESVEFRSLLLHNRESWPRCLLWHGWLPALACAGEASPWAASGDDVACFRLENLLGSYSEADYRDWVPPDSFAVDVASSRVSDYPDVWTDGSFVRDEVSGIGVGGCGVYSSRSGAGWFHRRWGHLELLPPGDPGVERCILFDSVRGPLQSVQRAELWGVILALQCSSAVHLGVDNLNVVRLVSRLLDGRAPVRPLELTVDGDLLGIIERMIQLRGVQGIKVTKVKGHADDDMVAVGRVRVEDRVGNDLADRAADLGRRRVLDPVVDVRSRFHSASCFWYPVVLELQRFFIAIARAAVNDDGHAGVALHPTVWSGGGPAKVRRVRISAWEFAWVPGPVGLWRHGSVGWPSIEVCDDDVEFWPYSTGLLVKFCSFLSSLHWPSTVDDLGVGGVSYVELLILYERWAGERLVLEMSVPKSRRRHRPISVSAVPDGPSIDIWRTCRFLGSLVGALSGLPGGLGRFLPCRVGSNHCRLRSIGWEKCGHGLTSRPLEASSVGFLEDLLVFFGYPAGSGRLLVDGSLRMRYCSANFSCKKPTWGLPSSGGVADLVRIRSASATGALSSGAGSIAGLRVVGHERKRVRLTKKTNVKKRLGVDSGEEPIPKRWRSGFLGVRFPGGLGSFCSSGVRFSHVDEPKGIG